MRPTEKTQSTGGAVADEMSTLNPFEAENVAPEGQKSQGKFTKSDEIKFWKFLFLPYSRTIASELPKS